MFKFRPTTVSASVVALSLLAAPAMAATTFGYNLSINNPVFNSTSGNLNVPDFQLENISEAGSGVLITDFNLTIGDTDFNYDFVRIEDDFVDTGDAITSTLNTVGYDNDGVGDDAIDYDFTGFNEGDIFRFEVDVDPDSGTPSQDFREALFPTAVVTVTFSNGETLSQLLDPFNTTPESYQFAQRETPAEVPLPAGLPLYLGALMMGGMFASRKRKA